MRSKGQRGVSRLKVIGTIFALLILGVIGYGLMLAYDLGLIFQPKYNPNKNITCPNNLRHLAIAVRMYSDDWDDVYPPASVWMDRIKDRVHDAWLHCPEVSNGHDNRYGYAMNDALSAKSRDNLVNPAKIPLFYDSKNLKPNAHDALKTLPMPGRHMGRDNIVFADGHVAPITPPYRRNNH